jgi:hypothetical protein
MPSPASTLAILGTVRLGRSSPEASPYVDVLLCFLPAPDGSSSPPVALNPPTSNDV